MYMISSQCSWSISCISYCSNSLSSCDYLSYFYFNCIHMSINSVYYFSIINILYPNQISVRRISSSWVNYSVSYRIKWSSTSCSDIYSCMCSNFLVPCVGIWSSPKCSINWSICRITHICCIICSSNNRQIYFTWFVHIFSILCPTFKFRNSLQRVSKTCIIWQWSTVSSMHQTEKSKNSYDNQFSKVYKNMICMCMKIIDSVQMFMYRFYMFCYMFA